jgi:chromosome segregation ATPase
MDERADYGVSESDHGGAVQSPSPNDDGLTTRLAELRAQLEVLAPPDQARGLETIEEIRQAQERIGTLELMLARAREREDGLAAQSVREQSTIAACETRIAELTAIAGRLPASEAARREAEVTVATTKKQLTLAQAEAEARQAEIERLRSRVSELDAELGAVALESVSAAVARAEVARVERELNEARDRAYTERQLAAADRRRAAEADLRAIDLQHQLRIAERRLAQLTTSRSPMARKGSPSPPRRTRGRRCRRRPTSSI